MGLQLIFAVEADPKCKSDWIYIKDTIEQFYRYERTQVKFSPVYMGGKGNYEKKQKEISKLISQYSAGSKRNQSRVIYCFDCDDYDSRPADLKFLDNAQRYCKERNADFVWFCKDIEQVYTGNSVDKGRVKSRKTDSCGVSEWRKQHYDGSGSISGTEIGECLYEQKGERKNI